MATSEALPHTAGTVLGKGKGRQALSKVRRELSEEESSSPAVQRMLLDDLERLETEASELRESRTGSTPRTRTLPCCESGFAHREREMAVWPSVPR